MKKIISLIMSIAICIGMCSIQTYAADSKLINDDLSDSSKIESDSGNLIFETKKLGSYENAQYATSSALQYEVMYKLDGMASFEADVLDFNSQGSVSFYAGADKDGEFSELGEYTTSSQSLDKNWTLNKYKGTIDVEGASYFKIAVTQPKAKYVRIDNVKIMSQFKLNAESSTLFCADDKLDDGEAYKADKLEINFNQGISKVPELTITGTNGSQTAAGKFGKDDTQAVYEFPALDFDVYTFSASGFETLTGQSCSFEKKAGIKAVYGIAETIHFGEEYSAGEYIKEFVDSSNEQVAAENLTLESSDETVIDFADGRINLKKPGVVTVSAAFDINSKNIVLKRDLTLAGAQQLIVTPGSVSLKAGESAEFKTEILLSDGTKAAPQSVSAESADYTVASVENGVIKAESNGNTVINITAAYYGTELTEVINVGVGEDALPSAKEVRIAVNRSEIAVGESIYAVVAGKLSDGTEADSLAMQKQFYSDNESAVKIDDDGRITALKEGNANIWAKVNIGGAELETEKISISAVPDEAVKAELTLPAYYMHTGMSIEAGVRVLTRSGAAAEDYDVEYKAGGNALAVSENVISAVAPGEGYISAQVTYNGKKIETDKVTVEVSENNGETSKLFLSDNNWNGVFEHTSDLTIYPDTGVMPGPIDARDQYVIFKSEQDIKSVKAKFHYLNSRHEDDIQIWVSPDNSDGSYARLPENKMSVDERIESGAWYFLWMEYSGELLDNARYVKVVIDVHNGENAQGKRLHEMHLLHDNAPEVTGVSLIDKYGVKTTGANAQKIAVTFSQEIDKDSLGGIKLINSETGAETAFDISYKDGIVTLSPGKIDNVSYVLKAENVKNKFGKAMEPYELEIEPETINNIEVKNISVSDSEVKATITNNTQDSAEVTVIACAYAADGSMNIMRTKRVNLTRGVNECSIDGDFEGADSARIYVWTELGNLSVY